MGRFCQLWQLDLTTGASTAADMGFTGTDCRGMVFGSASTVPCSATWAKPTR